MRVRFGDPLIEIPRLITHVGFHTYVLLPLAGPINNPATEHILGAVTIPCNTMSPQFSAYDRGEL